MRIVRWNGRWFIEYRLKKFGGGHTNILLLPLAVIVGEPVQLIVRLVLFFSNLNILVSSEVWWRVSRKRNNIDCDGTGWFTRLRLVNRLHWMPVMYTNHGLNYYWQIAAKEYTNQPDGYEHIECWVRAGVTKEPVYIDKEYHDFQLGFRSENDMMLFKLRMNFNGT